MGKKPKKVKSSKPPKKGSLSTQTEENPRPPQKPPGNG